MPEDTAVQDVPRPVQDGPTETTPVGSWPSPRKVGVLVTLPSGAVARLRRTFDLITMLKEGTLPNPLAVVVNNAMQARGGDLAMKDLDQESLGQMIDIIDKQIYEIFVSPRVVPVPEGENAATWQPVGTDTLSIADIDIRDRMFAFFFAQGGSGDLESFHQASRQAMAIAQHGQGVLDDSGEDAVDSGSVGGVVPERSDVHVGDSRGEPTAPRVEGDGEEARAGEEGAGGGSEVPASTVHGGGGDGVPEVEEGPDEPGASTSADEPTREVHPSDATGPTTAGDAEQAAT